MNKVFVIKSDGTKNILEQISHQIPNIGDDEVLIRHTAIGVNFSEYNYLRSSVLVKEAFIPGRCGVGVIEKIGKNVPNFKVGQKVAYATAINGAYSHYRAIHYNLIFLLPDSIKDEGAATNLLQGMTAHYLMKRTFFLREGMNIMIHGAAGNVGKLMMRLAREFKVNVIATVGSDEKKALVQHFTPLKISNYNKDDFVKFAHEFTAKKGVHVVYDFIGGDMIQKSLPAITNFGLAVSAGNAYSKATSLNLEDLIKRGLFVTTPRLNWYKFDRQELMISASEVFMLIAATIFPSKADKIYKFDEIALALEDVKNRSGATRCIML